MNWPLRVNPEAEADLVDAEAWYERQRVGLGDELLDCVEEVFDFLEHSPEIYAKVFEDLRLAKVQRIPYVVVYRVDEDQVTIVAIYHASRDPRGWQSRA